MEEKLISRKEYPRDFHSSFTYNYYFEYTRVPNGSVPRSVPKRTPWPLPPSPPLLKYWKKIQGQARKQESNREVWRRGGNQRNYAVNSDRLRSRYFSVGMIMKRFNIGTSFMTCSRLPIIYPPPFTLPPPPIVFVPFLLLVIVNASRGLRRNRESI